MDPSDDAPHAQPHQPPATPPAPPPRTSLGTSEDGDWTEEVVVTSLKPAPGIPDRPAQAMSLWARRLSRREKLLRVSAVALAVLLALAVIFGGRLPALVSGVSRVLTIRQLVAPIPTARTLTARPPVPLAASPWQEIGLPTPHDMLWSYVPVPSDPSTIYACASSANFKDTPAILWRSSDAGSHWQQMPLAFGNDTACWVQVADDGRGHVSVLAEGGVAESFIGNGCEPSALYLSRDTGATWRTLDPGAPFPLVEPHSFCSLTLTPHHLYAYHSHIYTANSVEHSQASLLRSDDGRFWTDAGADMHSFDYFRVQMLPERNDDTGMANVNYQSGDTYGTALFRSSDAGKHWRKLGVTEGFSDLMVSQEPVTTRSALASRMLYGLSGTSTPEDLYYLKAIESSDGQHWAKLPPLPVPGAAPDRVGVREVIGMAANGKLLFLGVDPHTGVPAPGSSTASISGQEQWLWAWDPQAQRWEVPQAPLRATKGSSHCSDHCWQARLAWGPGPDGAGYGTYVWVARWGDTAKAGDTKLYRTFIPAL